MAINQAELFNHVPDERIEVNSYDLSFDNVCTTEAGRLVVTFCRRVLPGEKWRVGMDTFARTHQLQTPIFGKMDIYHHAFFVRSGSMSDMFEDYIRGGKTGEENLKPDTVKFVKSVVDEKEILSVSAIKQLSSYILNGDAGESVDDFDWKTEKQRPFFTNGSLSDYLGLGSISLNDMLTEVPNYMRPFEWQLECFKSYQSIWSEYYADANVMSFDNTDTIEWDWMKPIHNILVSSEGDCRVTYAPGHVAELDDDVVLTNLFKTRFRCYAKDYFTSSLPEPQRGPDVLIPIAADIDILNDTSSLEPTTISSTSQRTGVIGFDDRPYLREGQVRSDGQDLKFVPYGNDGLQVYNANQLKAEISSLTATITDLRLAVALQEFYESSARYGNRYKEYIYGHFGSMIPDDQLVRPWYLGGMKMPIQISEVLQTAPDADGTGVGTMYGKGMSAGDGFLFERTFSDYGLIMVITSIRPRNYYTNSVKKEFMITDRLDEFQRKLQAVGEQEVKKYEVVGNFCQNYDFCENEMDTIFGYQMRFSEYKFNNDEVHGDFKHDLSDWTIARDFSNGAFLNADFLEVHPSDVNHIFQYTGNDTDHFLLNLHFDVIRETPMEIYSIPRIN